MFNDTIQSADLSEENKGAAEQEDLPRFFKSINHSKKLGWLAVQMRRPLRGGHWQTPGIRHFLLWRCSTWNLAVRVHRNRMRGHRSANADGAEAVGVSAKPADGGWRHRRMGKLASKLFDFCTGTRSETLDWRGHVMSFKVSRSSVIHIFCQEHAGYEATLQVSLLMNQNKDNRAWSLLRLCFLSGALLSVLQGSNFCCKK